jgi:hypothetical protein
MLNIKKIRYPEMDSVMRMKPNPEILLGKEIIWQEKRDGSLFGAYLDENNNIHIRSKNMDEASPDFYDVFKSTDEAEKIKELLIWEKENWHHESVIFGELLTEGISPTRTEFHKKNECVMFDIWSSTIEDLVPYTLVHQHAHNFDIPIVDLYGTSRHITLKSLYDFKDKMLEAAENKKREGIVGKTYEKNKKFKYFKERLDWPPIYKRPRQIEDGKVILPPLPESEILGALQKTFVDLGNSKFKDKKIAMPLFAKYVKIECKKHDCTKPDKELIYYYKMRLENYIKKGDF